MSTHSPVRSAVASASGILAAAETIKASGQVLAKLNQALQSPTTTISDIAQNLRCDVSLSARVIRIANGAFFFATKSPVKSIEEALQRVGLREVSRLIATATMQGMAGQGLRTYGISGMEFIRASLFCAAASQMLAKEMHLDEGAAYLAGLVRPVGMLAVNQWAEQSIPSPDSLTWEATNDLMGWERNHFGITHVDASGYIVRMWSFAPVICEAIESFAHLDENPEEQIAPLVLCLQVADALAQSNHAMFHPRQIAPNLPLAKLQEFGLPVAKLREVSRHALLVTRSMGA